MVAQSGEIAAFDRRGRAGSLERRVLVGGAVAVAAADIHFRGDFAVQLSIAMRVICEVTVRALHADLGMDIAHMNRAIKLLLVGESVGNRVAACVEKRAVSRAFKDGAEVPAMTMIVGELRVLSLGVDVLPDFRQEVYVRPLTLVGGFFRVSLQHLKLLFEVRVLLFLGPHERRIGFVIPHRVTEIRVEEHVRLMHVAVHALRGRDRAGEGMLDRMPPFLLARLIREIGNHRIVRRGLSLIAVLRVGTRAVPFTIVCINDVATRAARASEVAGLILRAHEPHVRIVEARLVNIKDGDRYAVAGTRPTEGCAHIGLARFFFRIRNARLGEEAVYVSATALEDAEDVCRWHRFPSRKRKRHLHHAHIRLRARDLELGLDRGGQAFAGIGLAEDVPLKGHDAVVVGSAAVEHGAGGHDRALRLFDDRRVASAAGFVGYSVVRRVDEADVLGAFQVQQCVGSHFVVLLFPRLGHRGLNMRLRLRRNKSF